MLSGKRNRQIAFMHYTEYLMRYDDGIRMAGSKICKLNYNAWKRLRLGDLLEYLFPAKNMLQRPDSFRAWTTSSLTQLTDLLWIWYIRSRTSYVLIKDSFVVYKNWCKDRDLELTKSRSSILILYLLNFSVTNAIVNLTCEYNDSNELVKVFERIVETTTWYDDSRDGPGDG